MNTKIKKIARISIVVMLALYLIAMCGVFYYFGQETSREEEEQEEITIIAETIEKEPTAEEILLEENQQLNNTIIELNNQILQLQQQNEELKAENENYKFYEGISPSDWILLYRVARAEAGATSAEGQMNVIYVVLNRLASEKYPDTIEEVLYQSGQFDCVNNGSFYKVEITDFTIENVRLAYENWINGEDAGGALFFRSDGGDFSGRTYLFTDEVGHKFFK